MQTDVFSHEGLKTRSTKMEKNLMANKFIIAAMTLAVMSTAPIPSVASAMPIADAVAVKSVIPTDIEQAYWRGRGWGGRGRGWGWGVGAGLLGGAIVGGLLAAPYYYGPDYPYYGPGPYYPGPVYAGPPPGDAVAYCMQRFKSYDPRSGTYLGYDGLRHPCP